MSRPKGVKNKVFKVKLPKDFGLVSNAPIGFIAPEKTKIQPIAENFSNGDLHILRDKINEIIKAL